MVITACTNGSTADLTKQYYTGRYNKYDGSKLNPYDAIIEIDITNDNDMTLLSNIIKSYVHSTHLFRGGIRSKANHGKSTALMLDFDNKTGHGDMTVRDFLSSEFAKTFDFVIYNSKSHTKTDNCYHVLVPLAVDILDPDIYTSVLKYVIEQYQIGCDENAVDGARFFAPSRRSAEKVGRNSFCRRVINGRIFDPTILVDKFTEEKRIADAEKAKQISEARERAFQISKKPLKKILISDSGMVNYEAQVSAIICKDIFAPELMSYWDAIADSIVSTVSIDNYADWIAFGHALKAYAGPLGDDMWARFCLNGSKFNPNDNKRYHGFSVSQSGELHPLMSLAKEYGWSIPYSLAKDIIEVDRGYNYYNTTESDVFGSILQKIILEKKHIL